MDGLAQPQAAGTDVKKDRFASRLCAMLVFVACALCFVPRMMNGPLRNWDEAWYAQVSRETAAQGNWLTLRWNDHNWYEKPPLSFWITGAFFQAFGESEITARLLSVLCGFGICLLVFAWVKKEFGPFAGLIAVLLLLSIPDFSRYVARGQMDAPITLLIAVSLWSYQRAWTNPNWLWLCNVCVGVGLMTKGSVAAFAWIILGCHACLARRLSLIVSKPFIGSFFLAIAIAAPWHAYQYHLHGNAFLSEYFGRHVGQLFALPDVATEPLAPPPYEPFFYFRFLLTKFAIWGWLTFVIFAASIWRYRTTRDEKLLLAICWFTAILLVLSLSRMKRGWYLFLLYPAVAMLATRIIADKIVFYRNRTYACIAAAFCALLTLGADMLRPASKEFESDIAGLAVDVKQTVPRQSEICTLQTDVAKESIYPISARYYLDRHVRIVVGVEEMHRLAKSANSPTFVLLTEQSESRMKLLDEESDQEKLGIETIARRGNVKLVRFFPLAQTAELQKAFK